MMISREIQVQNYTGGQVANGAAHAVPECERQKVRVNSQLTPPDVLTGDVDIADLADLLGAVAGRMATIGNEGHPELQSCVRPLTVAQIKADIRDCASALHQLQRTLSHELAKSSQLKLEVVQAQSALARQHVELLGTRVQERRARHMARHDSLTLLPNRSFFSQRLDQALAQERAAERPAGLAVLFLDLDGFKQVNDTHGHDVGDQVLKIVAARLRQVVRVDDLVGRLGGDEFACMLADFPGRAQIAHHVSKVFDAVCVPMSIGELRLMIQPSIGIAVSPDDGITALDLLKHADAAMYQTKRSQSGFAFLS